MFREGRVPEDEGSSPTLASLRSARGRERRRSGAGRNESAADAPQMGLLFSGNPEEISLVASPHMVPAGVLPGRAATRLMQPNREISGGEKTSERQEPRAASAAPDSLSPWGGLGRRAGSVSAGSATVSSATARERRVWGVLAIVSDVRGQVEQGYGDVWVEGEISNCRPASSGHLYLTLKEGEAQLPTVLFRRQAQLLRFKPAMGMAVLVRGRLSVYEGRGELQLVAETMEPRGAGALLVAF